jgi:hypothetical protein
MIFHLAISIAYEVTGWEKWALINPYIDAKEL